MLVLASRSPQRKAILEQLGVQFEVRPSDADELTEGKPCEVVVENALRKARAVAGGAVAGGTVLGADTEVFLDDKLFGKAASEQEAEAYLRELSGRTHEVWGGIALIEDGTERTGCALTRVTFHELRDAEIAWYLETSEWRDRAGAYAIQGRGAALVEAVEGDFWNVVGLPVAELRRLAPQLVSS